MIDPSMTADAVRTDPSVSSDPANPFSAVPAPLDRALLERGFTSLTPVQQAVLETGCAGRDLRISSQTGSGKTVALGMALAPGLAEPGAGNGPDVLIIVPTRELATQVCGELDWLLAGLEGVSLASVTGGTPVHLDRRALARRPRVLVGTPGRLLDHLKSGVLQLDGVRELVLDEADQMFDMGFREELDAILDATPEERRTHLVSATFPDGIRRLAERTQRDAVNIEGTRLGEANADIEHEAHLVRNQDRYAALVNLLLRAGGERALVFVKLRAEAVELADRLCEDGFEALPLSGELAQAQRVRTLDAFRKRPGSVLVATDVAARGLDVPDVRLVVHTAPPMDAQVYTHRSGRTGRAGLQGRSVLFVPPSRKRRVARLLHEAGVELNWLPVPTAAEVRKELAVRARAELEERLDTALEAGPSKAHLEHARALLESRESAPVVAALLAALEPEGRAEPRDVDPMVPRAHEDRSFREDRPYREPRGRDPRDRDPRDRDFRGGRDSRDRGPRGGRDDRGASSVENMVRFFLNRGANQGATPARILATVCRRGEVSGRDVGSIAIHPNASTFDVHADVAERFEDLASRRDSRDPQTLIRRDRGPAGPRRDDGPRRRY
jgi:ATP-dependent RNA helicase DeaD